MRHILHIDCSQAATNTTSLRSHVRSSGLTPELAAWQAVAWMALRASLPEPAQPLLLPRRLVRVVHAGSGTPWELALVLTRYLEQLKVDALPVPVRPVMLGPADPASLTDWPLAVVRVRLAGQQYWIDPTCSTCGLDGLRPVFDQAAALSPELSVLPALPHSTWHRQVSSTGDRLRVEVRVEGPLAVALRAELALIAPADRGSWLGERLAGKGAALVDHQGLVKGDQPLRLEFELPADAPLVPPPPGLSDDAP